MYFDYTVAPFLKCEDSYKGSLTHIKVDPIANHLYPAPGNIMNCAEWDA